MKKLHKYSFIYFYINNKYNNRFANEHYVMVTVSCIKKKQNII